MPKVLIIDACLAVDAGSKSPPARRGACVRAFLMASLDNGHQVGFTTELEREWRVHAARFARRWLTTMRSRRRVARLSPPLNVQLRDRTLLCAPCDEVLDAMDKDWHLIEGALASDRRVASSDDRARSYFATAAVRVALLKPILWVNPATHELTAWLENDALDESDKRLG